MKKSETAQLLAVAAAVDNRKIVVDESTGASPTVEAWHEAIGHLSYQDARRALAEHRRSSTEYLLPAHIVQLVGGQAEAVPKLEPRDAWLLSQGIEPEQFAALVAEGKTEREAYQLVRHEPREVEK